MRARLSLPGRAAVAIAAVIGLVPGAGVAYGLHEKRASDAAREAAAAVDGSQRSLASLARELDRADSVADVAAVGADAEPVRADLVRALDATDALPDAPSRQVAGAVLRPSIDVVAGIVELDGLSAERLGEWDGIRRELERGGSALDDAEPLLATLSAPRPLAVRSVENATRSVDEVVGTATRRLGSWKRATARFERNRSRERTNAIAYRRTVSGLLAEYAATRRDLQAWIDQVERYNATFDEAFRAVSSQKDARQRIRTAIAAAGEPQALAAKHNRLVAVIDTAIDAMDSATDGMGQRQESADDWFPQYDSYDETPAWQEFRSASARISTEFPAARAAWQQAIDDYVSDLARGGGGPRRPRV